MTWSRLTSSICWSLWGYQCGPRLGRSLIPNITLRNKIYKHKRRWRVKTQLPSLANLSQFMSAISRAHGKFIPKRHKFRRTYMLHCEMNINIINIVFPFLSEDFEKCLNILISVTPWKDMNSSSSYISLKGLANSKVTPEVARGMHGGYDELLLPSINVT